MDDDGRLRPGPAEPALRARLGPQAFSRLGHGMPAGSGEGRPE